jgi:hypothetical protein
MAAPQIVQFPRLSRRYPLVLPLPSVLFSWRKERLFPGLTVELTIDRPALPDNTVALRVRVTSTIDRIDDNRIHVDIKTHEFRTRGKQD